MNRSIRHARRCVLLLSLSLATLAGAAAVAAAADNQLTAKEKAAGWRLLFNGKDHTGWMCNNGKPIATNIEEGCLLPYKAGGSVIAFMGKQFGDFTLECDVKMSGDYSNSGIFFRLGDLSNPVYSGFEIQVYKGGTDYHSFGSIYDLVPPSKDVLNGPGQWNHVAITAKGPYIKVEVNGEEIASMNCDDYSQPGLRPDGTKHKFRVAIKDWPRVGYVALQDHGKKCWYKNVKILELDQ